jgi:hypothetical protein
MKRHSADIPLYSKEAKLSRLGKYLRLHDKGLGLGRYFLALEALSLLKN